MIQILRHREKQMSTAKKIRYLRGKIFTASTTMVTIQNPAGECIDLTEKDDIELAIMMNNMEKYEQSFHLPFLQPPLIDEFRFKGLTPASVAVRQGIYT
jgi:hypothetical protein